MTQPSTASWERGALAGLVGLDGFAATGRELGGGDELGPRRRELALPLVTRGEVEPRAGRRIQPFALGELAARSVDVAGGEERAAFAEERLGTGRVSGRRSAADEVERDPEEERDEGSATRRHVRR